MRRVTIIVLLLATLCVPAFAQENMSLQANIQFLPTAQEPIARGSLSYTETTYFKEDESCFVFRLGFGIDAYTTNALNDGNPLLGGSFEGLCGYTVVLNPMVRFDFLGGVNLFESSVTMLIINKVFDSNDDYDFTCSVMPVADVSVLFGMDAFSFRIGVKAGYQLAKNQDWCDFAITPYVGLGAALANLLQLVI